MTFIYCAPFDSFGTSHERKKMRIKLWKRVMDGKEIKTDTPI